MDPWCAPPGPFEMYAPPGPFEMFAPPGPFEMCAPPGPFEMYAPPGPFEMCAPTFAYYGHPLLHAWVWTLSLRDVLRSDRSATEQHHACDTIAPPSSRRTVASSNDRR
jgi:hypothetical protein